MLKEDYEQLKKFINECSYEHLNLSDFKILLKDLAEKKFTCHCGNNTPSPYPPSKICWTCGGELDVTS